MVVCPVIPVCPTHLSAQHDDPGPPMYEGRCGLPSNFDSTYCCTLCYGAGALLESGKTGLISLVGKFGCTSGRLDCWWNCIDLIDGRREKTRQIQPVIKKAMVELDGAPFKKFVSLREKWALSNCYISPGPIQFVGPTADKLSHTLLLELGIDA